MAYYQHLYKKLSNIYQEELNQILPNEVLTLIEDFITSEITNSQNSSLFSLSFAIAIWTASGGISTAMTAFDQIHQIPPEHIRPFWKAKLISLGLTMGIILLLILASFLVFISDLILRMLGNQNAFLELVLTYWPLLRWSLVLIMMSCGFAFAYRYELSLWNPGKPMMPGAVLAAICWAILSGLFRLYVSNFGNYNKVYGAVGTIIVLMLWLWMSAFILLVGDELNVTVGEEMRSKLWFKKQQRNN